MFLLDGQLHLLASQQGLIDTTIQQEEKFLAFQHETRGMRLAHKHAALAEGEHAVARLHHRTRQAMHLVEMPHLMALSLLTTTLTNGWVGHLACRRNI